MFGNSIALYFQQKSDLSLKKRATKSYKFITKQIYQFVI